MSFFVFDPNYDSQEYNELNLPKYPEKYSSLEGFINITVNEKGICFNKPTYGHTMHIKSYSLNNSNHVFPIITIIKYIYMNKCAPFLDENMSIIHIENSEGKIISPSYNHKAYEAWDFNGTVVKGVDLGKGLI